MLYQILIITGLIIFLVNLVLNLRYLKIPRPDSKITEPAPLVSVLIPARDEESNIANCLESLQKQDYPNYEVMVLNDNSTDNTTAIVKRLAAADDRIKLFNGEPLPKDWAGKPFACYQLAKKAKGSWLIFVDADTTHSPDMLRSVIAQAIELKVSLLSGFPRQLGNNLAQKIAIPMIYFILMSWLPLWWLQRSGKNRPSLAIGQFLLFPTDEYWRIGGHKAVKSKILEDVWIGVEINKNSGRHVAVDLSAVVACNMYRNLGEMWEGFLKWMYSVAVLSTAALLGLIIAGYIFFLAPFYWFINELFITDATLILRAIITSQVVIIIVMRWLVDNKFKEPAISTALHPIGFSFLFVSVVYAMVRKILGMGVRWKNRLYSRESTVK
ncbi:glycosyltransferase [Chloroflexota bacterium]